MPKMAAMLLKDGLQSRSKPLQFIKENGLGVEGTANFPIEKKKIKAISKI